MQKRAIFVQVQEDKDFRGLYSSTPHEGIRSLTTKLPQNAVSGRERADRWIYGPIRFIMGL
jgi:hypothetical protein